MGEVQSFRPPSPPVPRRHANSTRRREACGKVGPVNVLRDDEKWEAVCAAHVMHGNDVGMIEAGDGAGFGQVRFGIFGAIHQLAMRNFDSHKTLQLVVVSEIHDPEAALARTSSTR